MDKSLITTNRRFLDGGARTARDGLPPQTLMEGEPQPQWVISFC